MSKIFVVTSGEYSDKGIRGVFDNKKLAERLRDSQGFNECIEEYELNEIASQAKRGLNLFDIEMERNGDVHNCTLTSTTEASWLTGIKETLPVSNGNTAFFESASSYSGEGDEIIITYRLRFIGWAKNKEHITKIVNEKRIEILASNLWPPDAVEDLQ